VNTVIIGKIYHSREDRIAELNSEEARVQYKSATDDAKRIQDAFECVDENINELDSAVADYLERICTTDDDEDSPSLIRYSRRELVERWAFAQGALSKLAWVLRIDGNEATQRLVNALKEGKSMDMSGL
jgi:hypothetical protein